MPPVDNPDAVLRRVLDAVEDAAPVQAVSAVTREIGAALGATDVALLIADTSGRSLVRLTHSPVGEADQKHPPEDDLRHDRRERALTLPLDGGPAHAAMREQAVKVLRAGEWEDQVSTRTSWTVLAPIIERGEALGLLELGLPDEPDAVVVAEIASTAHLLGYVLVASRRHTDMFEWGQRTTPFSLSAEIQRRLLPAAYTCEAGSFTLSAWLEPASAVGGDTFDYTVDRDVLHLSMTDAMGHGVSSALTATLCVGSLRNTRRHGLALEEQAAATNAAMLEHAGADGREDFCTGLLGRVDLRTGVLRLVNAGHVPPYLARSGEVDLVSLPDDLPFGVMDGGYRGTDVALEPGDRLVLVTDGMLERNATSLDLPTVVRETRHLHPRETTRAFADLVLAATPHGLRDDATVLVLDWHGHHGRGRDTTAGAEAGSGRRAREAHR